MGPLYQHRAGIVKSFYLLFCIYFCSKGVCECAEPTLRTSIPHSDRFCQAFSGGIVQKMYSDGTISVYFSGYAQHFQRYLADLYHTKLYLILYLPLRDLSGVLWYSVVSSPRNIKDLLCRKSPESYPYLFFFVFMVSWHLWRLLRVYYSHFSDIPLWDICTYLC